MAEGAKKISEEELYQCLKSLDVPVRLNDIKNPTPEFMIRVFENFVKDLSIDPTHRPFNVVDHIEHVELTEDSISLLQLVFILNNLIASGLNITTADILFPKPKRTKKILNYLIVFWNYFLRKLDSFNAVKRNLQAEVEEADRMSKELEAMEKEIKSNLELIENEPTPDELDRLLKADAKKIEALDAQRAAVDEEYKSLKDKKAEIEKKIQSMHIETLSVKEKIDDLDKGILQSPEKVGSAIQKLKDLTKTEEGKIREMEQKLDVKKKIVEDRLLLQDNDSKDLAFLKDILIQMQQLGDTIKSLLSEKQRLDDAEKCMSNLQSEFQTKENVRCIFAEKSAKNQLLLKKQKDMFKENLEAVRKNIQDARNSNSKLKASNLLIEQELENEITDVYAVIEKCEKAEALTAKRKEEYAAAMEGVWSAFVSHCDEVKTRVKKLDE